MNALSAETRLIASDYRQFRNTISQLFSTRVVDNIRHTESIVELIVHAPMLAKQHHPGQFYRLQNFETYSQKIANTVLQTETVAALGVYNETKPDHLSFFIVEKGASTKILGHMKKGDPISVMGPTGAKIKIPETPQSILMIGNEMAIMYLLATGQALKQAGHTIHFVGIMSEQNRFALDQINTIADSIEFCEKDSTIVETRFITSQDSYNAKQIFVIGSTQLLKTMQNLRQSYFSKEAAFTASVYGSMQCMLKGVCAQCLQWQIDPVTGQRTKAVYACSWQHQPMEIIDIDNLSERQGQNRAQEILTNLWLSHLSQV